MVNSASYNSIITPGADPSFSLKKFQQLRYRFLKQKFTVNFIRGRTQSMKPPTHGASCLRKPVSTCSCNAAHTPDVLPGETRARALFLTQIQVNAHSHVR